MYKLSNLKHTIIFIVISLLAALYFCGIITPYGQAHNFFESTLPSKKQIAIYILLTLPEYIAYIVFVCLNFKKLKLRFISYPLTLFDLYAGLIYCLAAIGGKMVWLLLSTYLFFVVLVFVSFVIGLVFDIREYKTYN